MDFDKLNDPSSDEENPIEDGDTETPITKFKNYMQSTSENITLKKSYILHADLTRDAKKLVVGLSTKEFQIFDITNTGLTKNLVGNEFGKFEDNICGVKFFNDDENMLLAGTDDGTVHLYDLRSFKKVHTFEGKTG